MVKVELKYIYSFYRLPYYSICTIFTRLLCMHCEQFTVLIRDINYGQHLDHLSLLGYLHETRVRYLKQIGLAENNVDGHGSMLVVTNLVCNYKQECYYGETINVHLELFKESELRLVFKYKIIRNDKIVATAEISTAFINSNHKLIKIPIQIS